MSSGGRSIRFVVADERASAREALRDLVERVWSWEVVGEAVDGLEGVRMARESAADVLLVDVSVSGLDMRSLFDLVDPASGTVVVGLVDFPHQHAGARGVTVLKGVPADHLRRVIIESLDAARAPREPDVRRSLDDPNEKTPDEVNGR